MNPNLNANSPDNASREITRLPILRMQDVILARFVGREEAAKLGFTPEGIMQIATAISEITRNVVQHADAPGTLRLYVEQHGTRSGLRIQIDDTGKGIADAERAKMGGAGALGAGIPGARNLMDDFEIQSRSGATSVTMIKWLAKATP